jgi:hypothetical protein
MALPRTNQTGINEWADVEANDQYLYDELFGNITNSNIDAAAAIAYSKMAAMATGSVLLGNAGTPTATALSGDVTVGATGVTAIGTEKVLPAMLHDSILEQWRLVRSVGFFVNALSSVPVAIATDGTLESYAAPTPRLPVLVPINSTELALTGKTPKLRLVVTLARNATAPGTNIAFSLGQLATIAGDANNFTTSDVATTIIPTGATVTFTSPTASTCSTSSATFDVPTTGTYMFIIDAVSAPHVDSAIGGEIRLEQSWV